MMTKNGKCSYKEEEEEEEEEKKRTRSFPVLLPKKGTVFRSCSFLKKEKEKRKKGNAFRSSFHPQERRFFMRLIIYCGQTQS